MGSSSELLYTGVTRRVLLRELIVDILPNFARKFIGEALWDELENEHHILSAFHIDAVEDWIKDLPSQLHEHVLNIIRKIFSYLRSTDFDPEKKFLSVAWLYDHPLSPNSMQ